MKKNGKNEELQSRREFFKRAAKGALPILAGAALLSSPILSETANAMSCAGCNNRCMNSCFNTLKSYIYNSVAELRENKLSGIDLAAYNYLLKDFYKGGSHEVTLNENLDTKLFDETFIVFEIDSIKDDPLLFPLVTLIIMDVFIQKMRIKKNRKVLVIEEAWKAIASPMMAEYIKYLCAPVKVAS